MGLNIKNERVHALAREAADRLGTSQTSAIEQALERLLAEMARPADRVAEILADIDARLPESARSTMTTDDLYDENGLPA